MKLATPHWQNAGNATANVQHERWQPPYRERIANVQGHFTGNTLAEGLPASWWGGAGRVRAIPGREAFGDGAAVIELKPGGQPTPNLLTGACDPTRGQRRQSQKSWVGG
jgi:hypothetical protein